MKNENIVRDKSFAFALRIVKLYKFLCEEKHEYILSKQLLKSGTSIGANIEEADGAQSKKDFIAKMQISLKEAKETHYWLRLLNESDYIDNKLVKSFLSDCNILIGLLISILKTAKGNGRMEAH